jgi:hypothetical protein
LATASAFVFERGQRIGDLPERKQHALLPGGELTAVRSRRRQEGKAVHATGSFAELLADG